MEGEHSMQDHEGKAVALPEDARQEVVSYLRHQASKSTSDLLALVDRAAGWIEQSLGEMDEPQASFRPSLNEWSVADVLQHVDTSMRSTGRIIGALARGEDGDPHLAGIGPVIEETGRTLAELRDGVAQSYGEVRAAVATIPDGPAGAATARHPFFGDLSCKEWAAFVYVHSRDHANQIEQVKAHPGFPR
jgi:hypothetical protein